MCTWGIYQWHLSLCRTTLKSWGHVTPATLSIVFQRFSEVTTNVFSSTQHQATNQKAYLFFLLFFFLAIFQSKSASPFCYCKYNRREQFAAVARCVCLLWADFCTTLSFLVVQPKWCNPRIHKGAGWFTNFHLQLFKCVCFLCLKCLTCYSSCAKDCSIFIRRDFFCS